MICIIDCGSNYIDDIAQTIKELGVSCNVINNENLEKIDFEAFSGVIISGGLVFRKQINIPKYVKRFEFIKSINIPVLGICHGHQVIGLLYGSEIKDSPEIKKEEVIEIISSNDILNDVKNRTKFREEHIKYITLPNDFKLLARSSSCENEAMKHKDKPIYGLQFHPEMSGSSGKTIIKNFINITKQSSGSTG